VHVALTVEKRCESLTRRGREIRQWKEMSFLLIGRRELGRSLSEVIRVGKTTKKNKPGPQFLPLLFLRVLRG